MQMKYSMMTLFHQCCQGFLTHIMQQESTIRLNAGQISTLDGINSFFFFFFMLTQRHDTSSRSCVGDFLNE